MAGGAHDEATLNRYADAQAGSSTRAATAGATARSRLSTASGSATTPTSTERSTLLWRRADARVARPGAGGRPRPAAARRADQPPRHRVARVARAAPGRARRRGRAGRARPLVPGGGRHVGAGAGGRARGVLPGSVARVADGEGRPRARAGPGIERQQAEIERLERFVTRFRAGTRARQAQSRAKRLSKIDRIDRAPQDGVALEFTFKPPERSGRVSSSCSTPAESRRQGLLHDAEMWLERGEHVSLVGPTGPARRR